MELIKTSTRAGRYIKQPTGYHAFVPSPLPPNPRIKFDDAFLDVLSRAVGRLHSILLESLYRQPVVSTSIIGKVCGVTFQGASDMAKRFSSIGILEETTGQKRHRLFAYAPYLTLLGEPVRPRGEPPLERGAH